MIENEDETPGGGRMLKLYEQIYVLCLHEEKTVPTQIAELGFPYWFGASLLADLTLGERVLVKEKQRLSLVSGEETGDHFLDEILQKILSVESAKKISYWMNDLDYKSKKVFRQISEGLIAKAVLRQEEDDFSWAFPEVDPSGQQASAKFLLKSRLRALVLTRLEPERAELFLLSLLKASDKLDLVFFKDERKLAARWINERMMSEAIQDPIAQTVQEIEAALLAHIDIE